MRTIRLSMLALVCGWPLATPAATVEVKSFRSGASSAKAPRAIVNARSSES